VRWLMAPVSAPSRTGTGNMVRWVRDKGRQESQGVVLGGYSVGVVLGGDFLGVVLGGYSLGVVSGQDLVGVG